MARVAIIFDNFGPYHLARLDAAARVCDLLAVEVNEGCLEHYWSREHRAVRFQSVTLAKGFGGERLGLRRLRVRLRTAFEEFKPQVVFIPGWSCAGAFVGQHWCIAHSVPAVVMSESNSWDEMRSGMKEWVKRRLAGLDSAALVGGTSHRRYMMMLGMPEERVFLGYNAVDNDYFSGKARAVRSQRPEVRGKLGLSENYFLASARFVEKKNLSRLLEAYARYRQLASEEEIGKQKPEIWNLVLLGDGPLKSDLCHLISELGLQDSVLLPGFKQYGDLPAYYALASAFVHASTSEQWGLVVNEAMASGLPVLVSNRCGCAADLVQEGRNGFTFDPANVEQLAHLMFQISAFQSFRLSAFGDASRQIIVDWGTGRFAQGVRSAVDSALAVGPRRMSPLDRVLLQSLAISGK